MEKKRNPFRGDTDKLPETDEELLIFYSELLVVNMPSLISDLSSAKYTFLSFSEKTRTEVKQKHALLQSISRTFSNLVTAIKATEAKEEQLAQREVQLVTASPPRFLSSDEALQDAQKHMQTSSDSVGVSADEPSASVMVLHDQDLRPVREAEVALEAETTALSTLATTVNQMEDQLQADRAQCQEMTTHVQTLKWKYDAVYQAYRAKQRERKLVGVLRDELLGRRHMEEEAQAALEALERQCTEEEMGLLRSAVAEAKETLEAIEKEQAQRREKHEVELAAYQIAWKTAQARAEALQESITFLRGHQKELALLAKRQQLEESSQNSLRRLMWNTLTLSPSKKPDTNRPLTSEQEAEVRRDHDLVTLTAARIAAMERDRRTIGGILIQTPNAMDTPMMLNAMQRVHEVLAPPLTFDTAALREGDSD